MPPWHIVLTAMNLPGAGPSVPVDRVSPPVTQELEARGEKGVLVMFTHLSPVHCEFCLLCTLSLLLAAYTL